MKELLVGLRNYDVVGLGLSLTRMNIVGQSLLDGIVDFTAQGYQSKTMKDIGIDVGLGIGLDKFRIFGGSLRPLDNINSALVNSSAVGISAGGEAVGGN